MINYTVQYNDSTIYTSSEAVSSLPITYNNQTIATLTAPVTAILPIKEKECYSNIGIGSIILPTNNRCGRDHIIIETTQATKLFTASDFNAATKTSRASGFSYSVLTNQQEGSDGLSITGRSAEASSYNHYLLSAGTVILPIDLTGYSTLSFYARKTVNHGMIMVRVTNTLPTSTTEATAVTTIQSIHYNNCPTTWTLYTYDVSALTGQQYLLFQGGYVDSSGNTSSNTQYCDIKLE